MQYISRKEDRECFYTLCPLFFASIAFVVANAILFGDIFTFVKYVHER